MSSQLQSAVASLAAGLVLSFAALPAHGQEAFFEPNGEGQIEFMMPSGNIGCVWTPEGGSSVYVPQDGGPELKCERIEPVYMVFTLGPSGPATSIENPGEAGCCSGEQFPYGWFWRQGEFRCESTTAGLSCTRGDSGFLISRKIVDLW